MKNTMIIISVVSLSLFGKIAIAADVEQPAEPGYTIPLIDLSGETHRQVIVDRERGQYLGHPTTVLLEDNKTIIAVYPKGHGAGTIIMKHSYDGGLTWSERLKVPENWATSKEVPTIFRMIDKAGVKRLVMFSGLYPIRSAISSDDGLTWTPLKPIGDFGGIVAMGAAIRLKNGDYMALFHDNGGCFSGPDGKITTKFYVYKTISSDGGLTWSKPSIITQHPQAQLCEPGIIRSPDGNQIAVLFREESRKFNSFVIFSDDEGETWTKPRQLPAALTGDRHTAKYARDGRLFITFRDMTRQSPTKGDWVGWVGTYGDIAKGNQGQYRVRLMDNKHPWDNAYPGLEFIPDGADGTFVATTYGHWTQGENPYIVSVRFKIEEIDEKAKALDEQFKKNLKSGTIPNASFEEQAGFNLEYILGWSGDHQPVHGNAWGSIPQEQFETPETPYGEQWAFISSDGFKDPVSMWTATGIVEDDREYQFGFLAGQSNSTTDYKPGHHFEVGIWAGDSRGPKKKLASESLPDPALGKTKEFSVKLNSGSGYAGDVLYLVFSKPYENGWSQILLDNVHAVSAESMAKQ